MSQTGSDHPLEEASYGLEVPVQEVSVGLANGSWLAAARFCSQISQFVIIIVAARFVAPADFGTFALLSAVGVGLSRLAEAGWREFIMVADSSDRLAQTHFLAVVSGLAMLGVGLILAVVVEQSSGRPDLGLIMGLLSVGSFLTTLCAVQSGILVRRNNFAALGRAQIAGEVLGFAAALAVLIAGGGLFGLVTAKIATTGITFAGSLMASRWFALQSPQHDERQEALKFSARILVTRLISFAHDNVALFAIGIFTGPASAGLFRASGRLAGAMAEVINEPFRLLAWSILQRPDGPEKMNQLIIATILLVMPLFVGLAITSQDVILIFLGVEWIDAAPLLFAFSIAGLCSLLNIATEPLLVSNGQIAIVPKLSAAYTMSAIIFLLLCAPFGVFWIAVGQAALAAGLLPVVLWIQTRYGGISPLRIAKGAYPALIGSAALIAAVLLVSRLFGQSLTPAPLLAAKIAAGAVVYGLIVLALVPLRTFVIDAKPLEATRSA